MEHEKTKRVEAARKLTLAESELKSLTSINQINVTSHENLNVNSHR